MLLGFEVYPTVKVRVNEQDDQFPPRNHDNGSMLFLSLMDSLSIQGIYYIFDSSISNTEELVMSQNYKTFNIAYKYLLFILIL